jgi:hypothetical protein
MGTRVMTNRKTATLDPQEQSSKDQSKASRKRLNLDLAPAAYDLLQKISEDTDKNMADVLRTGLALYGIAHEAQKNNQEIGIIKGEKVIKAIVIT